MLSQEESLVMINEFLEKTDTRLLVMALTPSKTKVWNKKATPAYLVGIRLVSGCVLCEEEGRGSEEGDHEDSDRVWGRVTHPS